jgi:hypothetical protein
MTLLKPALSGQAPPSSLGGVSSALALNHDHHDLTITITITEHVARSTEHGHGSRLITNPPPSPSRHLGTRAQTRDCTQHLVHIDAVAGLLNAQTLRCLDCCFVLAPAHAKSINCRQPASTVLIFRISIVQACGQIVTKRHWSDVGVCATPRPCKKEKKSLSVLLRAQCRCAFGVPYCTYRCVFVRSSTPVYADQMLIAGSACGLTFDKNLPLLSKQSCLAGFVFHLSADPASPSCKESSSNAAKLNGANLMPAREKEKRVRCRRGSRLLAAYLFR